MIPDPLKDWYADEKNTRELIQVLELPIVKKAMAVLQFVALPRPDPRERPSPEMITGGFAEQQRNAGFFSYPDHLWQLTEVPKAPMKNPEGYSDSYVKDYARRNGMWDDFEEEKAPQDEPTA